MNYSEVYLKLTYETASVIFVKKDGTIRNMLATRNVKTMSLEHGFMGGLLAGHDNRCSINNGNIAVFDLTLGDVRAFNVDRIVSIDWYGEINTKEEYDIAYSKYKEFLADYERNKPKLMTVDMLD